MQGMATDGRGWPRVAGRPPPSLKELAGSCGAADLSTQWDSPDMCAGMDNGGKGLGMAIREAGRLIAHEFFVKYNRLILHSFQA